MSAPSASLGSAQLNRLAALERQQSDLRAQQVQGVDSSPQPMQRGPLRLRCMYGACMNTALQRWRHQQDDMRGISIMHE